MSDTVILGTARTPFGRLGGGLASLDATSLGACAVTAALQSAGVWPDEIALVVLGQAIQDGQGQIPSRQTQLKAGIPETVPSETINKACASGMRAVGIAETAIRAGDATVAVAGGMESMSNTPVLLPGIRFGFRMGTVSARDSMTQGLTSPWTGKLMITEADEAADDLGISRADLDIFAERSHRLAAEATEAGRLAEEITPVAVAFQGDTARVARDESIRPDTNLAVLGLLHAATGIGGTHTAGNSPGVNDGACALVLASAEWAAAETRRPLARILSYGAISGDVASLAQAPSRAAKVALDKIGRRPDEVDLWEINEAFASVTLNSIRALKLDEWRVNVNGGAIALGHPVGASGARIIATLVHELRRRGGGLGCAAICSAGGQGDAIVLEVDGCAHPF